MCVVTFDWTQNDAIDKFERYKKKPRLTWAVVELTEACNFNCIWCYANKGNNLKGTHMSKKRAFHLIKILAEAGLKQITCSGGEPLMYPYLKEFIKEANEYGLNIHIITNGYFLNEKLALELKNLGLTQVQTNIDSISPWKHDRNRGMKGSFKRAINALIAAKKVGLIAVSQTVLTKNNENEIFDIFRLARRLGLQRCRVWDLTPSQGKAFEIMDTMPSDYIGTLRDLSTFAYLSGAVSVESGEPLFPLNFNTKLKVSGGFCVAMKGLYTTISTQGNVLFCATLRDPLYNIFEVEFDLQEYHKFSLEKYLNTYTLPSACLECEYKSICNGGCLTRIRFNKNRYDYLCSRCNIKSKISYKIGLGHFPSQIVYQKQFQDKLTLDNPL